MCRPSPLEGNVVKGIRRLKAVVRTVGTVFAEQLGRMQDATWHSPLESTIQKGCAVFLTIQALISFFDVMNSILRGRLFFVCVFLHSVELLGKALKLVLQLCQM